MTEDSGESPMPDKPLYPRAWDHYAGIVCWIGAVLVFLNTLIGSDILSINADKWLSFLVTLLVAVLVWLHQRRMMLFGGKDVEDPWPPLPTPTPWKK
jgi:hypothetical protein